MIRRPGLPTMSPMKSSRTVTSFVLNRKRCAPRRGKHPRHAFRAYAAATDNGPLTTNNLLLRHIRKPRFTQHGYLDLAGIRQLLLEGPRDVMTDLLGRGVAGVSG